MTAPDSRDSVERVVAEMRRGGGTETGWIGIDTARGWADRLQALARGPHAPTPIPGEYADERMEQPPTFSARYFKRRAEAAEAALREAQANDRRYRWLRKRVFVDRLGPAIPCGRSKIDADDAARTDAAIDAALNGGQDDG